jgi:hypothetical protein
MAGCKLDLGVRSCLDRNVPIDEEEASGSAIGLSTQNGTVAFVTTHWSVGAGGARGITGRKNISKGKTAKKGVS